MKSYYIGTYVPGTSQGTSSDWFLDLDSARQKFYQDFSVQSGETEAQIVFTENYSQSGNLYIGAGSSWWEDIPQYCEKLSFVSDYVGTSADRRRVIFSSPLGTDSAVHIGKVSTPVEISFEGLEIGATKDYDSVFKYNPTSSNSNLRAGAPEPITTYFPEVKKENVLLYFTDTESQIIELVESNGVEIDPQDISLSIGVNNNIDEIADVVIEPIDPESIAIKNAIYRPSAPLYVILSTSAVSVKTDSNLDIDEIAGVVIEPIDPTAKSQEVRIRPDFVEIKIDFLPPKFRGQSREIEIDETAEVVIEPNPDTHAHIPDCRINFDDDEVPEIIIDPIEPHPSAQDEFRPIKNDRFINFVDYMPQGLDDFEVREFMQVLQDLHNGLLMAKTSGDSEETLQSLYSHKINTTKTPVSMLKKIELIETMRDPDFVEYDFINDYAKNSGFNIDFFRKMYEGDLGKQSDGTRYLRNALYEIPNIYTKKTTDQMISSVLYAFGVSCDVVPLATKDYKDDWVEIRDNHAGLEGNEYYPTGHCYIRINLTKTRRDWTNHIDFIKNVVNSYKPIGVVIDGFLLSYDTINNPDMWLFNTNSTSGIPNSCGYVPYLKATTVELNTVMETMINENTMTSGFRPVETE